MTRRAIEGAALEEVPVMATKKSAPAITLPDSLRSLQDAAAQQIQDLVDRLPDSPALAVEELRADLDKTRRDLTKRAEKAVREARVRAEAFAKTIRRQIEVSVAPVTRRFDVATRSDVDRLRKRIDQLERRIGKLSVAPTPTSR